MQSQVKVGVQTRPWGPANNRTRLPDVLAEVAAAGYDGFEIGAQHLDLARPEVLRDLAAQPGLAVVGIHVGGDLTQDEWSQTQFDDIHRAAAYAAAVDAVYLPFSGRPKPGKTLEEYQRGAEILNRVGAIAQAHGLRLCYHNHDWEIRNDCEELAFLIQHTDPALVSLCLDVAWVRRGGASPVAIVQRFANRIGYCHIKDTGDNEWLEVGYGTVDFDALLPVIQSLALAWLVVEQDETRRPPVESARLSRDYLKTHFDI